MVHNFLLEIYVILKSLVRNSLSIVHEYVAQVLHTGPQMQTSREPDCLKSF